AHSFGFAIYSAASDRYEDAVLLTGLPIGSPQEALDTACTVHLTGLGHEPESRPPTNLRSHPLKRGRGLAGRGPWRARRCRLAGACRAWCTGGALTCGASSSMAAP